MRRPGCRSPPPDYPHLMRRTHCDLSQTPAVICPSEPHKVPVLSAAHGAPLPQGREARAGGASHQTSLSPLPSAQSY